MGVYTETRKAASSMGREPRRRIPKDNIDLDMEDAERLGYGVQYGRFKADHPNTKEAHEARLYPKKKQPQEELRVKALFEKVCPVCGKKFTTPSRLRIYCNDLCKAKNDNTKWTSNAPKKKEAKHD